MKLLIGPFRAMLLKKRYFIARKHFGGQPQFFPFYPIPKFLVFFGGNCYTLLAQSRAQCESARSAERNQRLLSHVTFGYARSARVARAWARFAGPGHTTCDKGKMGQKSTENIHFQFFMPNGTLNHALLHVARLFALT